MLNFGLHSLTFEKKHAGLDINLFIQVTAKVVVLFDARNHFTNKMHYYSHTIITENQTN